MGVLDNRVRDAVTLSSGFDMQTMRLTTVLCARPKESCWQIVVSLVFSEKTGREPWMSSNLFESGD